MMVRKAAERPRRFNAPLQGSAADIIKMAMIEVDEMLPQAQAKMLLQVHDEFIFEVDAEMRQNELAPKLAEVSPICGGDFCPLVVEVGKGNNWDEAPLEVVALYFFSAPSFA